tara:strand:+ start:42 stop:521 length:480 start_codon:yes stop_codon:yes gene_type:complete
MVRSAKQRANDRRLGRMAKARAQGRSIAGRSYTSSLRNSAKRKASSRRKSTSSLMARRRSTRRRSVGRTVRRYATRRSGSRIVSTIKPMATGIGGGILTETVANRVGMGQYGQIAGFGGAYLFGGMKGVLGKLGFDLLSGRGISFFGGQQNTSMVGLQI